MKKDRELGRYFPFDTLRNNPFEHFGEIFPSLFGRGFVPFYDYKTPAIDFIEEEDRYRIKAEVPGFNQNELKVNIEGNRLELSAKKEEKKEESKTEYKRQEIFQNEIYRALNLPEDVDLESMPEASLKEGILEIIVKKIPTAKPELRKIEVKIK